MPSQDRYGFKSNITADSYNKQKLLQKAKGWNITQPSAFLLCK